MRIANNIMAMNAHRQLTINQGMAAKSIEKLSSGFRINRAGDDAAGLAISEKMRGQIRGLKQAIRNAQDGISLIQTAEGALTETHAILQRMRELAVQAANDTNDSSVDRKAIEGELTALKEEIDRIANTTQFNTKMLLNGSLSSSLDNVGTSLSPANGISAINIAGAQVGYYSLEVDTNAGTITLNRLDAAGGNVVESQTVNYGGIPDGFDTKTIAFGSLGITVEINANLANITEDNEFEVTAKGSINLLIGANAGENMQIQIADMRSDALGITSVSVATAQEAEALVTVIDEAINQVSTQRSQLGAYQNRLEHTIANLGTSAENLQAAESRIRDVDMAQEMMNFTKYQILQQASTAMLAQANLAPQSVLQLLG